MKKREVVLKEKDTRSKFLSKPINLLLREEKPEAWEKVKKIAKITALALFLIFLLALFSTFLYSWSLSSYGHSLTRRAEQAKAKISSLRKEEVVYLSLIKKIKRAEEILDSRGSMSRFLNEVNLLLPPELTPHSLSIRESGEVNIPLSCSSLSDLENLNENLKKAIDEGKILNVKIEGVTKDEESLYKLTLSFQVTKE